MKGKRHQMLEGWNLYHKSAVFALWGMGALAVARAVIAIDGGTYEVTATRTVAASPEAIWPWITKAENRTRWQAKLVDMSPLMGDPGEVDSTRMLFWRDRHHHWTAIEATREVLPGRLYRTVQQSDADTRIQRIDLVPGGECQTEIMVTEQIRPSSYTERVMSFLVSGDDEERLEVSLEALDRWLRDSGAGCAAPAGEAQKGSTS